MILSIVKPIRQLVSDIDASQLHFVLTFAPDNESPFRTLPRVSIYLICCFIDYKYMDAFLVPKKRLKVHSGFAEIRPSYLADFRPFKVADYTYVLHLAACCESKRLEDIRGGMARKLVHACGFA